MESKIIRTLYVAALSAAFLFIIADKSICAFDNPQIRVAVLQKTDSFILSIRGRYKFQDENNQILKEGRNFNSGLVVVKGRGIKIGNDFFETNRLKVSSLKDISILVKDKQRRYRGALDIVIDDKEALTAINVLDLEEYTKGVLYHEVSHRWPLEAIKAQAVATRTYALYQWIQNKNELFDVKSDIYSQVYGGRSAERYRTNIAANRTEGQILIYKDKVLPAYFAATCGGKRENVKELWNHDLSPLKGGVCDYCVLAPYYRWVKNFRSQDVQEKLNKNGFKIDSIEDIQVFERTESGRVKSLKIKTRSGHFVTIPGKKFREILGPNILKSNYFEVQMKGYFFDVLGKGWGHGVGMCQWGAYFMAKERFSHREILEYYYPGADIQNINEVVIK